MLYIVILSYEKWSWNPRRFRWQRVEHIVQFPWTTNHCRLIFLLQHLTFASRHFYRLPLLGSPSNLAPTWRALHATKDKKRSCCRHESNLGYPNPYVVKIMKQLYFLPVLSTLFCHAICMHDAFSTAIKSANTSCTAPSSGVRPGGNGHLLG